MNFADKKGITVASGFKLQAEALLDARGCVEDTTERDELVDIHAVAPGLRVFVKADKTAYTWDGTQWVSEPTGVSFTSEDKQKLAGIQDGANKTVVDEIVKTGSTNPVQNNAVAGAIGEIRQKITDLNTNMGENFIANLAKGAPNGVAELDSSGKVPSSQLPGFVDDVIDAYVLSSATEFSAGWLSKTSDGSALTPEKDKIYNIVSEDKYQNTSYRWSGTAYVRLNEGTVLGETENTAYRGDRGKAAYEHSQKTSGNPHNVTKADVGLGNVPNVTTNNQTVTYTEEELLTPLESGETMTEAFAKLAKIVKDEIALKGNFEELLNGTYGDHYTVTQAEKTKWNNKQDKLTIDSEVSSDSSNPVTSAGIAAAIKNSAATTLNTANSYVTNQLTNYVQQVMFQSTIDGIKKSLNIDEDTLTAAVEDALSA